MALSKEEMRRKLLELSETDRNGLADVLHESLEEKQQARGMSKSERLMADSIKSEKPN